MDLNHYVYALLDPRNDEIFYIGKGQGARVLAHTYSAKNGEPNNEKERRIIDIQAHGLEVRNIILAKNFKTNEEALAIESLLWFRYVNRAESEKSKPDMYYET